MGLDLWRSDHSDRDSRSPVTPFDDGEHSRRELSAEGAPQGRPDSFAGVAATE